MLYRIISLYISSCLFIVSYPVNGGSNNYLAPPSITEIDSGALGDSEETDGISRRTVLKGILSLLPAAAFMAALKDDYQKNLYPTIIGGTTGQRNKIMSILRILPLDIYAGLNTIEFRAGLDAGGYYFGRTKKILLTSDYKEDQLLDLLIHELGHHTYKIRVSGRIRRKLSRKHNGEKEAFGRISRYAKDETHIGKRKHPGIPPGNEAFAEIHACWAAAPGLLFLHLNIAESDALRFFIEKVAGVFTFKKTDGFYVRYYLPEEMDKKYVDVKVSGKSISFEKHRQNYLDLLPRVAGDNAAPEYHVKAFSLLSFLYGKEYTEGKDTFVISAAGLQTYPSKIHPRARAVLSQLSSEWLRKNTSHANVLNSIGSTIHSFFKYELLREDIRQEYQHFHIEFYLSEAWFLKDLMHVLQTTEEEEHGTENFKKRMRFMRKLITGAGIDLYDIPSSPIQPPGKSADLSSKSL